MNLHAPDLDDRSFQDLVDDAKRYIMERCEGWTDHNVSDPGVTLVEAFAWMTDLLLYRLNRVPERSYVKFLDLLGVTLRPPGAATLDVDFRLSASLPNDVTIPDRTVVSTERTADNDPVLFTLIGERSIRAASSDQVLTATDGGRTIADQTRTLGFGDAFDVFSPVPQTGDALYLAFPRTLSRHLVLVTIVAQRAAGHGIDPDDPPLVWEISTATGWSRCELVTRDHTSGLNENGRIELALPDGHAPRPVAGVEAHWLRCRLVDPPRDKGRYRSTPRLFDISAATIGVVGGCINATMAHAEMVGRGRAVAGQEVQLANAPVVPVPGDPLTIDEYPEEARFDGRDWVLPDGHPTVTWTEVDNFADSGPTDRHFTLDATSGTIRFGPEIREADGSITRYGAVPAERSHLVVHHYWFGGGGIGNVRPHVIRSLRTSVPNVAVVRNRTHGRGGVDAETLEEAKRRGPIELRARNRAVTAEDFEYLARGAAPGLARVKCVEDEENPGMACVRLLVVPATVNIETPELGDLVPSKEQVDLIRTRLDRARLIGTTVSIEPPSYQGMAVVAELRARPDADPVRVRDDALSALYRHFNPITGGEDGDGWPFGREVRSSEAMAVLQRCPGVDVVESLRLLEVDLANPNLDDPGRFADRTDAGILLNQNELIKSDRHRIEVIE